MRQPRRKTKNEVDLERLKRLELDDKIRRAEIQTFRLYAQKYPDILKEEYLKLKAKVV